MNTIITRIKEIADNERITITLLEKGIGASKGVLSRPLNTGTDIQSKWIIKIVENYPLYSTEWLLTGKGEMLKVEQKNTEEGKAGRLEVLKEDKTKYENDKKQIPFVSINAIGGFGNSEFSIAEQDVKDYYVIPKFKDRKIDFMIEVCGSSMYPKYNSGDVVACRAINESNFIQWNKVHIIATEDQGILIKRLKKSKSEDCLLAVSDNKDYEPFDIPLKEITGIAIVVGVVRLE